MNPRLYGLHLFRAARSFSSKMGLRLADHETLTLTLFSAIVGVATGYVAIGFRAVITFFQNAILYHRVSFDWASPLHHGLGVGIILIPPLGLYVVWLLTKYLAPESKGHGVPEVMEAVAFRKGIIRKRVVAVKALASSLTIACGGSVGREGPIVQIGSAVGSSVAQLLRMRTGYVKVLLGCGAAAGIAATFNAPIAGVIFAFEIILLEFKTRSFVPLVVSAVMATIVSRIHLGVSPAFVVPAYALKHPSELIFYLGLGILAGFVGIATIKSVYGMEDFVDRLKVPSWSKPVLFGLVLGCLGLVFPHILGVGYETVSLSLTGELPFVLMAVLIVIKIIAVSLTLAAGGSGGVFAPSLFIGAMLGGAYGYVVHLLFPSLTAGSGAYALVGMAALFSATGRATLSAIVILFEMTLDYNIILPLMFACVIADQIATHFYAGTIYTIKLKRRGVQFSQDLGVNVLEIHRVGDVMSTEIEKAQDEMTMAEVRETLLPTGHFIFPIVDENQWVTGVINASDVRKKIRAGQLDVKVKDIKYEPKTFAHPSESLMYTIRKMDRTAQTKLPVIERASRKLVGIITARDIMRSTLKDE